MKIAEKFVKTIKNKKKREETLREFQSPEDFFEPGTYFTWIRSDAFLGNTYTTMPCKATILKRKGAILTVIIDDLAKNKEKG